jgi:type IV secretory pathway VirJ component
MTSSRTILACFLAYIFACGIATAAPVQEKKVHFAPFDTVTLYYAPGSITNVVLFISGDGGWNLGVVTMARSLQSLGTLVAGVDIRKYLRYLTASYTRCLYPAGDLELLSKFIQKECNLPKYIRPILVGYSSGATLAYAALVQAPGGTFSGAVSMGFCPDLPMSKEWCRGFGLTYRLLPKGKGVSFDPTSRTIPWIAFQGDIDQVCPAQAVEAYVKQVRGARLVMLPMVGHGFSVEKHWLPQFKEAFKTLTAAEPVPIKAPKPNDSLIAGLPLIEVPSQGQPKDCFAVLLTGDGGWAEIDKSIADALAADGVTVIGWNSLDYYWTRRTPEEASKALAAIITYYRTALQKDKAVLMGYSLGADVLPFIVRRLPKELFDKTDLIVYLGLSDRVDFKFSPTAWLGGKPSPNALPVIPEIEKLKGKSMLYFYGKEESDKIVGRIDSSAVKIIELPGGHHFDGRFDLIARDILSAIAELPAK